MYDDIVIGAGSAGAVIAARLSEDPGRRILLIEAGPDYESLENTPHSLINGFQPSFEHDWGYSAEMVEGRTTDYARGKVTGGCSAVNACVALRGIPADYDEWSELGNTEWSWQNVRPYSMQWNMIPILMTSIMGEVAQLFYADTRPLNSPLLS